jgi:quinol monooxygenase YgiN
MDYLEVIARAKVRPGEVDGLKAQAAEIVRLTRERDTHTLRCDWFLDESGTEFEVHEMFTDEQALAEHSMHIMEARTVLFRDYAYDHRPTLYGDVSQGFLDLLGERMGKAPAVFSFLQGLETAADGLTGDGRSTASARSERGGPAHLEVHAHLKIRPGQLDGFKAQVAEIMRLTREHDTQTVRYDWFLDGEGTECEVHEVYLSGQGLVAHNEHVMDARAILFERYAYDHRMTAFGEVSAELRALAAKHAGGIGVYAFLQGLETAAAV